jgi:hypothetical protein
MSTKSLLRSVAGALLLVSPLGPVAAQDPPSLSTLTELKCTFPVMSTGTWTKEGDATNEAKKSALTLVYQEINTQEGTAEVKGFTGNLYITVRLVSGNLHLLTTDSAGPVYMTTVFNSPTHPGKFKAAHSRHEFTVVSLPGFTSRPEQYIGECQIVK